MKNDITAIILTKNEEANIARCMESLGDLPDRIVVVDSGSTDATVRIAQDLGAEIYYHPFKHYADQFNWALEHTEINTVSTQMKRFPLNCGERYRRPVQRIGTIP